MKHFYFLLILLFSFNLMFAQDEMLLGEWSLDSIFDYDILLEDPNQPIIIEFTNAGNEIIINNFCGVTYTSQYTSTTNDGTIEITGSDAPPMPCSDVNQESFHIATYNLLGYDTGEPKILDYSFTQSGNITTLALNFFIIIDEIPSGVTGYFTKAGQTNSPINGEWYVQSINTDGVQHDDYSSIFIDFNFYEELDELNFMGDTGCDGYTGSFEIIDNNTISHYGITRLASCEPNAYGLYAEKYYDILNGQNSQSLTYLNFEIIGTGTDETLTISNQFGDFIVYGRENTTATIFKTWHSYSTETVDGIIYPSPLETTTLTILATENQTSELGGLTIYGNGGCNYFDANHNIYTSNENEFNIYLFNQTFVDCSEDNFYEPTYFSVLGNEANGPFSYELQDDGNTLVLTNTIGEVLTFGEQAPPANIIGQWYLHNLVVDTNQINNPSGSTPDIFFSTNLGDLLGFRLYGSGVCNGFQSDYYLNPQQSFNAEFISATLAMCDTTEEELFENYYFTQVLSTGNNGSTELHHEITGTGDDATLVVTNLLNGNQAYYGRQTLSIDDNEFNSSEISLNRNPVSNRLDVSTNQNLIGSNYEIFSITGQRITNGVLDSNSINVNQLHSGLYFLKVSTDENVFETVKFIKD
nr:T9SS type A sorting domain-containing protein [uncultured Psychroserpens sp.]